jgi:AraC-like DNA-binding protein
MTDQSEYMLNRPSCWTNRRSAMQYLASWKRPTPSRRPIPSARHSIPADERRVLAALKEDATVGQLADRLGYRSEAAFSRAFKRVIGVSPGAIRRSAGEQDRALFAAAS